LASRRLNLGILARLRGIPAAELYKHRHSAKFYSLVAEALELEALRPVKVARYTGVMAAATHPNVDYEKAITNGVEAYYKILETIPYLLGGVSSEEMKQLEREEAVKEWKRTCAMDKNENYKPEEKLEHKRVGE